MSVGKFPNLRLLHVFITVAKYQGYANAQQELNLTVSAISNYMSELEEKLGIILCRRGRGGFSLTEKGETVLQQSIDLLNSLEDFERNTATLRGEQTGIFNLGVIDSTITDPMLPMSDIIATFSERFPRVQINLQVRSPNALLQGVLNNELDLAVGTFSLQANSVISHPLYREQNWLYCGDKHPLFTVKHLTEALISPMRMVTRSYWSNSDLGRKGFKQSEADAHLVRQIYRLSAGALCAAVGTSAKAARPAADRIWLPGSLFADLSPRAQQRDVNSRDAGYRPRSRERAKRLKAAGRKNLTLTPGRRHLFVNLPFLFEDIFILTVQPAVHLLQQRLIIFVHHIDFKTGGAREGFIRRDAEDTGLFVLVIDAFNQVGDHHIGGFLA